MKKNIKHNHKNIYKNSLILKELISVKSKFNDSICHVSNYGHYVTLFDGLNFKEDSKFEVSFPNSADLSLSQNKGFTIFFWCMFRKSPNGVYRYVFKKGNNEEMTPGVGLLPNGTNLFVKFFTSKNRLESLFSTKKIEYERLYNFVVTFDIDYNNELTDVSLFIDGLLDCQLTVPGEPIHNQCPMVFGKSDNLTYGFNGWLADVIVIPSVLNDNDLLDIGKSCFENVVDLRYLKSYYVIEKKLEQKTLLKKYSEVTGIPIHILENMDLKSDNFKEVLLNYNIKLEDKLEEPIHEVSEENIKLLKFKELLGNEQSLLCISSKSMYTYLQFIYTIINLSSGKAEEIEITRVINIFEVLLKTLHIQFTQESFTQIAKALYSYSSPGIINIEKFFKTFKSFMYQLFPELSVAVYVNDSKSFNKNVKTSVELHENLLISTQNFKHLDLENQKDLDKNSYSIKSYYNRIKSGKTLKETNYNNIQNYNENLKSSEREDFVNQEEKKENNEQKNKNEEIKNNEKEDEYSDNFYENFDKKESFKDNNTEEEQKNKGETIKIDKEDKEEDVVDNDKFKENTMEIKIRDDKIHNYSQPIIHNMEDIDEENDQFEDKSIIKRNELQAKFPEDWNQGNFEIVINRCYDCHLHKTTTKHIEATFIDKFNEIGDQLKSDFPNIKIIGNFDTLSYYGCFDIYIRGVGPHQDDENRYFLFILKEKKRFPTSIEISDKLITLSMLYGSSVNMAITQSSFLKSCKDSLRPSRFCHEYPADLNENAEKHKELIEEQENFKKQKEKVESEKTKYVCSNWGCTKGVFVRSENNDKACTFHSGVFQFGSYHAYWPEAWSCCEGSWESQGCCVGRHKPEKLDKKVYLCVNIGEQNPNTGRPNSACGAYFREGESSGCSFHPGYIQAKRFTCCGREGIAGCQEGNHHTAHWPDDKAKLYFYPKINNNPGLIIHDKKIKQENNLIAQQICKSGLFKASKPYDNPKTKYELLILKREKEKTELKTCLNWACGMQFKDIEEENLSKSCLCHPGKFDHGSTGTKMRDYMTEIRQDPKDRKSVLWEPHWTCCRGPWESKGCKYSKHKGIFTEEFLAKKIRPFSWPDIRAKLYFGKIVSDKWKELLKKYTYPYSTVKKLFLSKESGWSVSQLPELCDRLKLYLLLISEKPDYHMKFNDVVTNSGTMSYFEGGSVKCDKFMKWWFSDYEEICEELDKKK